MIMHVLHHGKDVVIVLFGLGPLRAVTAILNLQRMQPKPLRKLVQLRRGRVRNIKPGQARKNRNHAGIVEPWGWLVGKRIQNQQVGNALTC